MSNRKIDGAFTISIPTGTIKSARCRQDAGMVNYISIPTGTIKRVTAIDRTVSVSGFQFLPVRLKDIR